MWICGEVELKGLVLSVRMSVFSECTLFLFAGTGVHSEIIGIWIVGVDFLSFSFCCVHIFDFCHWVLPLICKRIRIRKRENFDSIYIFMLEQMGVPGSIYF